MDASAADADPMRAFFPAGFGAANKRAQQQKSGLAQGLAATSVLAKKEKERKEQQQQKAGDALKQLPAPGKSDKDEKAPSSSSSAAAAAASEEDDFGPRPPSASGGASASASSSSSSASAASAADEEEEEAALQELLSNAKKYKLPITHEAEMAGHEKTVAALALVSTLKEFALE